MPLTGDANRRNVDERRDDSRSILTLYRRLLSLRRDHSALSVGAWRGLALPPDLAAEVFAYERIADGETLRILLNFSNQGWSVPLDEGGPWQILRSTHSGRAGDRVERQLRLEPDEGVILGPPGR